MKTPIETFLAVIEAGGKLDFAADKLRMLLPADSPPELKAAIRHHKPALLELLRLNFMVVRSDTLNTILFWTPDEVTKEFLATAGADPGCIYMSSELERLVGRRVIAAEIPLIHAAKHRLGGKVTEP